MGLFSLLMDYFYPINFMLKIFMLEKIWWLIHIKEHMKKKSFTNVAIFIL